MQGGVEAIRIFAHDPAEFVLKVRLGWLTITKFWLFTGRGAADGLGVPSRPQDRLQGDETTGGEAIHLSKIGEWR